MFALQFPVSIHPALVARTLAIRWCLPGADATLVGISDEKEEIVFDLKCAFMYDEL